MFIDVRIDVSTVQSYGRGVGRLATPFVDRYLPEFIERQSIKGVGINVGNLLHVLIDFHICIRSGSRQVVVYKTNLGILESGIGRVVQVIELLVHYRRTEDETDADDQLNA